MTDVEILLSVGTSEQEKLCASMHLIEIYDLPLTQEEILKVFNFARYQMSLPESFKAIDVYNRQQFLFDELLTNNKYMFLAITKAYNDNKIFNVYFFTILVGVRNSSYSLGHFFNSLSGQHEESILKLYRELLDYNDFDTNNLIIDEKFKIKIQQYQQEKYGGKLIKAATNI